MRLNIFAQVMTFVLTWTLLVTALPSNAGGVPGISLRQDPATALLGINCRGSSECGGYCHPNIDNIKYFVDQIDDKVGFSNGQMIACHRCANCSDCPDQDKRGICVFPQSLNPGEKVTAKVVKASIGTLISHGCKKCGSNPIHPGNNVGDGQVTINFVRDFCKTGVCDTAGAASPEDLAEPDKTAASTTTGIATLVGFTRTTSEEEEPPILPAFSPRDAAPDSAAALLGINCRGSVNCNSFCNRNIFQLRDYITQVSNTSEFSNGQKIACIVCKNHTFEALCAFPNNMKTGESIDGAQAKDLMTALIYHGCKGCGSVPVHSGNNVNTGQLTVNWVMKGCGEGVCQ